MAKIRRILLILTAFLIVFSEFLCELPKNYLLKASAQEAQYRKTFPRDFSNSTAEIVIDKISGRVLYSTNADEKKYMASTTKILTAIVVIENCDLNENVTVTEKTVGVEGSSVYLEKGEILSVKDLLYGLMLRSGNDCAETLAIHCSGSIKDFAALMNKTATKIGAKNSNFKNPHGLHDDEHYTTARDLAKISAYCMKNPDFKEIVGTKEVDIPFTTRNTKRRLINKNKMLKNFDGATGIKTGFTKKAGRCLVSSAERDGAEYICVTLNCPPMFERSSALLSQAFACYKPYKLAESDHIIDFVDVENSEEKCPVCLKEDVILPLTERERKNLKIIYDYPRTISRNLKKDAKIGTIKILCENTLLFEEKIYTIISN